MKPFKTLLFLVSILSILIFLSLIFPKKGISITQNFTLKFISIKEIFDIKKPNYADITEIVNKQEWFEDPQYFEKKSDSIAQTIQKDTTISETKPQAIPTEKKEKIQRFEFPKNNISILYPIFKALDNARNKELIRILHYGDSQIEGDRITAYLRNKFQSQFGGSGVGLLPAIQEYDITVSMFQTASDNWKRFSVLSQNNPYKHSRFGAVSIFSKFANENKNDSTLQEAWLKFTKSTETYETNRKFVQCKLFYGYNKSPVIAELYSGENLTNVKTLFSNNSLNKVTWDLNNNANDVTIKFAGKESPEIYGIAFDDKKGVAVDNLGLRGSSGLDFSKHDFSFIKQMYKELNVKMLILEYGINVAAQKNANYKEYERWFYSQLQYLKRIDPNLVIIVIGVSDISKKVDGNYVTNPAVFQIRDAQKNAAFKAGCVFWDLFEAMGGENSMPSWAAQTPTLSAKDYAHFSYSGSKLVAQMFYEAFIYEYNQHLQVADAK